MKKLEKLLKELKNGNRRALARAITLVESTRADHREEALLLMDGLSNNTKKSIRIGLTGTPGVGKSTFIESFGLMLVEKGMKVAVLAVDPTSRRSGGSILGDKTRMELLSRELKAFIRPSPSGELQGGVALRTREAIALCEAAQFDIIIVETVGVGQSEVMVSEMTDIFLLLIAPGGGDELQGVKRGIMEIADLILVNKADGDLKPIATRTCADYTGALRLLRKRNIDPEDFPKVMALSSLQSLGLDQAWSEIKNLNEWRHQNGVWDESRKYQSLNWFNSELENRIFEKIETNNEITILRSKLGNAVFNGEITPDRAANTVLTAIFKNNL